MELNKVKQITEIDQKSSEINQINIIKWSPSSHNNMIAIATNEVIEIINVETMKIHKEFSNVNPKSIRWSPDGSKLAFLTNGDYKETISGETWILISPPSLWIYDIEKDSLEEVDRDPDSFDFLWIN